MDPSESGVSIKGLNVLAKDTTKHANEVFKDLMDLLHDCETEREQRMLSALVELAQQVRSLGQQMQGVSYLLDEMYGD